MARTGSGHTNDPSFFLDHMAQFRLGETIRLAKESVQGVELVLDGEPMCESADLCTIGNLSEFGYI